MKGPRRHPGAGEGGSSAVATARLFLRQQVPAGAGRVEARCPSLRGTSPKSPEPSVRPSPDGGPLAPRSCSEPPLDSSPGLARPRAPETHPIPGGIHSAAAALRRQPGLKRAPQSQEKFAPNHGNWPAALPEIHPNAHLNSCPHRAHRSTGAENHPHATRPRSLQLSLKLPQPC